MPVFRFYYLFGKKHRTEDRKRRYAINDAKCQTEIITADKKYPSAVISAPVEKILLRNTAVAVCAGGKLSVIKL